MLLSGVTGAVIVASSPSGTSAPIVASGSLRCGCGGRKSGRVAGMLDMVSPELAEDTNELGPR